MNSRINKPDTHADLTLRQLLQISSPSNFIMVAGAGSGKTTSLIKALAYIGETKGELLRKRGQKLACITYTEVAVSEILKDIEHFGIFHVSTIHSFLWSIIRPFQSDIAELVKAKVRSRIAEAEERLCSTRIKLSTKDKLITEIKNNQDWLDQYQSIKNFKYSTGSNYKIGVLGHNDIIDFGTKLLQEKKQLQKIVAGRFPFLFVDESQDTKVEVYNALRRITEISPHFCLGFFGDPMQKIYSDGIGRIGRENGWELITKKENFRCAPAILSVLNNIRDEEDKLLQTLGKKSEIPEGASILKGSARVFIFPFDDNRSANVDKVREWISKKEEDPWWSAENTKSDVRILVLVHRMAASRLGFLNIYSVFNDLAPHSIGEGFIDGTSWPLVPFLRYILPLVNASNEGNQFKVIQILRQCCPQFHQSNIANKKIGSLLKEMNTYVQQLSEMFFPDSNCSIGEVLNFLITSKLIFMDERFSQLVNGFEEPLLSDEQSSEWVDKFLQCNAFELWGYFNYIQNLSPYSTQQGVKGAEFNRVLVILDDEEGKGHNQFSYGKFLGLLPLSVADNKNIMEGKDNSVSRSRRLFYVCCSRALKDLAVAFFTNDVVAAKEAFIKRNFFPREEIYTI